MKPQIAEFDEEKAQGIIDRVSSEPFEDVSWILDEPVKTLSKNAVDDTLQKNVEFQGKSGLSPKIVRTASADACEWCQDVAGTYEYPNVPDDVYRRHANCNCIVEYVEGGKIQNVHTKAIYTSRTEEAQARRIIGTGENEQNYKAVVLDRNDKKTIIRGAEIRLSRLENPNYEIYVSDKVILKPREQQVILQSIDKSLKLIDTTNNPDLPAFAVVDDFEIADNVLAAYNYVENRIYLRRAAGNKNLTKTIQIENGLACPEKADSTMLHELFHWKAASDYRRKHGEITADNAKEYMAHLSVESKAKLDNLGINADNVEEIGDYAKDEYLLGEYDEVLTEYRVFEALR